MDFRTPILVGSSAITQKLDDPLEGRDAIGLMEDAVRLAIAEAGAPGLLALVGEISVPAGTWAYPNPAGVLGRRLATSAATLRSELGVLQSSVIHRAINRIADGELDAAIVVGGEAKFRELQAAIAGIDLRDRVEDVDEPDTVLSSDELVIDRVEINAGLIQAVQHYAFIEHALRANDEQSLEDHRRQVAALVASFNDVAQHNDLAWNREPMSKEFIATFSERNKPLALPYAKWHNSQWNVDQAAALIITSVGHAQELGIPSERWVFPRSGADSNNVVPIVRRAEMHRCPGVAVTARKALDLAGVETADLHELYSCFPSAVRIQQRELGLGDEALPPTITGGMAFGGGPFNNFVLQASAQMAGRVRAEPGSVGLVSAISGMLTKQGFTAWSSDPNPSGWGYADTTAAVAAATATLEIDPDPTGSATIVSYTVLYSGMEPTKGVAIADTGVGRTIVATEDTSTVASMAREEWCGRTVEIGDVFA